MIQVYVHCKCMYKLCLPNARFPFTDRDVKHIQIMFLAIVRYHLKRPQIAQTQDSSSFYLKKAWNWKSQQNLRKFVP